MLATVEDLKKGDTVIIAIGSTLSEVKLLRQPQLAKIGKKTTWYGRPRWSTVPCSVRYEEFTYQSSTSAHTWKRTYPVIAAGKDYNTEKRVDFTDKTCWIIKREQ